MSSDGLSSLDGTTPITAARRADAPPAQMVAVNIWVFSFHPSTVRITPGTTVAWTNHGSTVHTATATKDTAFDTGAIQPGQSKGLRFNKAGTYPYHCSLHPFMTGVVIVK